MLEGKGGVYETKGCDPFIVFKDAYFLYAANNIHKLLTKDRKDLSYEEKADRSAIDARMSRH